MHRCRKLNCKQPVIDTCNVVAPNSRMVDIKCPTSEHPRKQMVVLEEKTAQATEQETALRSGKKMLLPGELNGNGLI